MIISPLTHNDSNHLIPFVREDWISATKTRNYILGDPILDWLNIHGKEKYFKKDKEYSGYNANFDFTKFLFKKGH
jgi:hypothetical protein